MPSFLNANRNLKLLISVLIPILASALQWELWPLFAPKTWIFLYPAVFLSASIGSFIGGIIATGIAAMIGLYVFIEPKFSWASSDTNTAFSIMIFAMMGLLFSLVFGRLHRSTRELQRLKDLKLELEQKRLSQALDAANAGIWEWHPETNHNEWGDSIWLLYGIEPHSCQPSYDAWFASVHPDDQQTVEKMLTSAVEQRKELNLEWRVANMKPDQERWLMARGVPEFDPKGKLLLYRGVVIDITERKRMEQTLLKKERHLSESQAVAHIGSWEQIVETGQIIWSDETFRLVGMSPEVDQPPPVGEKFLELFHADDRHLMQSWLEDCLAGKQPHALQIRTCPKTGKERWLLGDGVLETDASGKPVRMIGTAQDITENKRLLNEKQRWADAFNFCAHGIAIGDPDTRTIITCNPAFAQMLGYDSPKEIEGMAILALYPSEQRETIKHYIGEADRLGHYRYESSYIHKNGGSFDAQVDLVSVKNNDYKILYRVATIQDITDKKRAAEELQQLNVDLEQRVAVRTQELAALNNSLESFVYSVSHDLKTPLRGIEGYSRLLQEDFAEKLDGEGMLFLSNIRDGIGRMNDLIDDLLAYSRMSRRKLDDENINIELLLKNILRERNSEITKRRIKVDLNLPPLTACADKEGLTLALRNLVENAFKFSQHVPEPHIEIGAKQEENSIVLWVKDNGIGFDMKYSKRIFEIFQRLHHLEDYPGTGIGLALVKTAMQRMNGKVWAESQPNHGATFFLEVKSI